MSRAKKIAISALTFFLLGGVLFASAQVDQSVVIAALQKQIQELLTQLQTLQKQVTELKSELGAPALSPALPAVSEPSAPSATSTPLITPAPASAPLPEFTRSLALGSSGDDVRRLQEFLAKNKDIYPDGLITGYFGPLTEKAVKRWQEKNAIEAVGRVGPKTIAKLNELITEGAGKSGVIPPGLLKAPGLQGKIATSTGVIPTATTTISSVATSTQTYSASTASVAVTSTTPAPTTTPITATAPTPSAISSTPTTQTAATATTTATTTTSATTSTPSIIQTTTTTAATIISHTCGQAINVPRETASIQTALNSACAGDVIYVAAGAYYENLVVPKENLTIKGAISTAPENVIIDGQNKGTVIRAEKIASFTVEGVTVQNGNYQSSDAGIHLNPIWSGTFIIRNVILKNNAFGVMIWNMQAGSVTIERSLIVGNIWAGIDDGHFSSATLYLTNNTIVGNKTGYHDFGGGGQHIIKNNIIANNTDKGVNIHKNSGRAISYNNFWQNSGGNYLEWFFDPIPFAPSPGTGELSVDPKFVSNSDFHLQSNSPMINAGDPAILDPDGTRSDIGAYYFSAAAPADTTPPAISNIQATSTAAGVSITWITNEASDSQAEYGATAAYGLLKTDASLTTNHSLNISGLSASTTYHYRVKSKDAAGNLAVSADQIFTTLSLPSAAVQLPAPTYIRADWSYGWWDIAANTMGRSIIFKYPTDSANKTTVFRLYAKNPGENAFSVAAEFTGIDSTSCSQTDKSIVGQWILDNNASCGTWVIHYVKSGTTNAYVLGVGSFPLSIYTAGEYSFYVSALNSAGQESAPSAITKLGYLNPLTITSPAANQMVDSLTPTFQWTVDSATPGTLPHFVVVFDSPSASNPIWSPYFSGGNSKTYGGPTLDPAKQYIVSVFGIDVDTAQNKSTLIMPSSIINFSVKAPTTTATSTSYMFNNFENRLAQIYAAFNRLEAEIKQFLGR